MGVRLPQLQRGQKRVTERDLEAFEITHGISLPSDYRRFLVDRGSGGNGHCLSMLDDWCQPWSADEMPPGFLAAPFALTAAWNDMTLDTGRWESPYFSNDSWKGAMRIVNAGCESYYLLVVSGPARGMIWFDGRVDRKGIFALRGAHDNHVPFDEFARGGTFSSS